MITAENLESEFASKNLGWLWDESWNGDANTTMTLSVTEVRQLANMLRQREKRKQMEPQPFSELAESKDKTT